MTSEQILTIALAVIGLVGGFTGAIKWGAGLITKAIDRSGARIEKNTDAMIANTHSNATLSTKIDSIANFVHGQTPGRGVQQSAKPKGRAQTHPQMAVVPEPFPDEET